MKTIVVERKLGPVGEWQYLDLVTEVDRRDQADLRELLRRCEKAAEMLGNERLLVCDQVAFIWTGRRVEAPLAVPVGDLATTCEGRFAELVTPFAYPDTVELTGWGVIDHADGHEERVADAVWISASSYGHHDVTVMTQVDAWLPWGLDAKPQAALSALNAPRLGRALEAVGVVLGLSVSTEPGTQFANHDGVRLVNQYDSTGAPVDCSTLLRKAPVG